MKIFLFVGEVRFLVICIISKLYVTISLSKLLAAQLDWTKDRFSPVNRFICDSVSLPTMFALAILLSFTSLLSSRWVTATQSAFNTGPVVQLSYGSFQGNATADLEEFLGIPFAAPPYGSYSDFACAYTDNYVESVGNLRFAHPKPPLAFTGVRQTTRFGAACPQQAINISFIPVIGSRSGKAPPSSEDCKTVIHTYWLILF